MRLFPLAATLAAGLAVTGCTQLAATTERPQAEAAAPAPVAQASAATAVTRAPAPRPVARATPAQLDTTTPEQRVAAAKAPASAEARLGTTVGSLGNPSEGGFWIKTPLVQSRAQGRIVNPATGKSAQVELIPLTGGGTGSQVSLPALQLLGVSLTDLPTLEVYRS